MDKLEVINKWQLISNENTEEVIEAIKQQHYAVQYIAMTSKYLIDRKKDDNHVSMRWIPELKMFVSNKIEGNDSFYIGVEAISLELHILKDKNTIEAKYSLNGKSFQEGFEWLREQLIIRGINNTKIKKEILSSVPDHEIAKDGFFNIASQEAFVEASNYRTNADMILKYIGCNNKIASPPRIWPSHFATTSHLPLRMDADGEPVQSIRIGFTNRSKNISHPYFYVNFWDKMGNYSAVKFPNIAIARWVDEDWHGGIVTVKELMNIQNTGLQASAVLNFFEKTIESLSS